MNETGGKHGGNLGLNFSFLVMGVSIGAHINWWGIRKKVDVVLNGAGWGKLGWFGENGEITVK